jgi:radical SAM superfamily enzyme YgiQ (UPF0313 family)
MPPLGLASLAAWLRREEIPVRIVDVYARPGSLHTLTRLIQDWRPTLLGLSCTTSSFLDGVRVARDAKRLAPGLKTVVGGPHVSALKERSLDGFPEIDFGVVGEGEQTLTALANDGWRTPAAVPGLVYRDADGTPRFSGPRTPLPDLDALPFPAYDLLEGYPRAYKLPIFNYPRIPNSSCVSSRGCPYACSYCDRSVFGRSFRYNSAAYMLKHVRHLREQYGVRHINFYDDQFTFHRQRIEEFATGMMEANLGMTYNCAARAEHLDPGLLRLMKQSGCWMISLGIETGDPELLARHRSRADLDLLRDRVRMIQQARIRVKGLLMLALPGETPESVRRSMDYVRSLRLDDFNLTKFTPFPGAPLYEHIRDLGTFEEDWPKLDCMHFQFVPKGFTREQLEALHKEFYKRHFMQARVLWDYTTMAWRSPDSWKRFWLGAGSFLRFAAGHGRRGADA